jgi:hypothetical protein
MEKITQFLEDLRFKISQLLMAYRSSKHASTKVTPNKMTLGREITLPVQTFIREPEKDNREVSTTTTMYGPFHFGSNFEHTPIFLVGSCNHTACPK